MKVRFRLGGMTGWPALRNIRVKTISPGPLAAPIWSKTTRTPGNELAAMQDQVATTIPSKRIGRSEEVAAAALFLASDKASFTTGMDPPVDGGGILGLGYARESVILSEGKA